MAAIEKQLKRYYFICNAFVNYKKVKRCLYSSPRKVKFTWDDFERLHEILEDDKGIDKKDFVEDIYSKASEAYLVASGQFQDCILEDRANSSQHSNQP